MVIWMKMYRKDKKRKIFIVLFMKILKTIKLLVRYLQKENYFFYGEKRKQEEQEEQKNSFKGK